MQREKERTGFLKLVKDLLKQAMEDTDQCSDEELSMVVGSLNCERHGFIRPSDYVNTDEAMKFLRIRSRNKFFETARKLGIESKKINNQPIGFSKRDVERMHVEIHGEHKDFF